MKTKPGPLYSPPDRPLSQRGGEGKGRHGRGPDRAQVHGEGGEQVRDAAVAGEADRQPEDRESQGAVGVGAEKVPEVGGQVGGVRGRISFQVWMRALVKLTNFVRNESKNVIKGGLKLTQFIYPT